LVGLVQAKFSAVSNHVAHKCLDPDVIALEPEARPAYPRQEMPDECGVCVFKGDW
jgi:hypothetical protein